MHISSKIWIQLFVCLTILALSYGQYNRIHNEDKVEILDPNLSEGETRISWCTVSKLEQYKCQNLSMAIQRDRSQFGADYMELHCKQAFDSEECMTWVDDGKASILSLDAGEVYIAGRYHSLVPILQQIYEGGFPYQYAVAVVKKGDLPNIVAGEGLHAMRGAKACFPLVGSMAGWVLPIHMLMQQGGLKVIDCNNHIKSAIEYFGESCAINSLVNMYNPIGDNSDKLCTLCDGGAGIRCTPVDPYAGYNGALRCLLERGDVAFLRHTTISRAIASRDLFPGVTEDRFELICPDGSRGSTSEWLNCNWGRAPADAIVASSAKDQEHRAKFQRYLQKMVQIYGQQNRLNQTQFGQQDDFNHQRDPYGYGQLSTERPHDPNNPYAQRDNEFGSRWDDQYINNARRTQSTSTTTESSLNPIERFHLFDSIRHGTTDLLVQDSTVSLKTLGEGEQAAAFVIENGPVGIKASEALKGIRDCPIKRATLCLTSDAEKDKCIKMRVALKAAFLAPDLVCLKAHSARVCERFIEEGQADFAVFDSADMLHAAAKHRLVPFMTEIYSDGTSSYYAVAVAKEQDPDTDITYLRGKNTCHTGISMAAGWIYPLAYLISNGWIRSYGCDGARAASEYFTKSCAPGALSSEYADTSHGVPRDNLCQLCHGGSWRRCRREHDEPYYGHTGALRCLVEGGGDVAFVRHTAPAEVSGGRRTEWWSRNLLYDDLQLLCPDGTRAKMFEYERCNLGRVPGSVLMGRPNHTELDAFANLMVYAEQLYGATTSDDFSFSMFYSPSPYADLIFSDAAVRLRPLPHAERSADLVAGPTLPRAARLVSCDAASADAYIAADPEFLSGAWKGKDRNWGVLIVGVGVSVWLIVFG